MQENKSQSAIKIIERLKKLLKIKTDIELSEFLNIRPNTISTWKKRDSVDFTSIISICELYELDLNEIFLDKKGTTSSNPSTPLILKEAQFQYSKEKNIDSMLDLYPKYNFPFITAENSRAFQVTSNNMFPIIDENSFVICEKIEINKITDNAVVVLISNEKGLLINRITKSKYSDSLFVLKNDNDIYSDIKIDISEIKEVWNIIGCLSYEINNQNKMKFISESLKKIDIFLDKQNVK